MPTRCQKDNTNQVELAERTTLSRYDQSSFGKCTKPFSVGLAGADWHTTCHALAGGHLQKNGRDNKMAIEIFLAGSNGWVIEIRHQIGLQTEFV